MRFRILALVAAATLVSADTGNVSAVDHQPARDWSEQVAWSRYASVIPSAYVASRDDQATAVKAMIEHHQDAIDGSLLYLPNADDPYVAAFAERLIRVQTEQIAELESWLAANPDAVADPDVQWMAMCGTDEATRDDSGYLANMIVHHEAAVEMYRVMVAHGDIEDDDIGRLMRRIGLGQVGEIEWMRQQLTVVGQ